MQKPLGSVSVSRIAACWKDDLRCDIPKDGLKRSFRCSLSVSPSNSFVGIKLTANNVKASTMSPIDTDKFQHQ